jgi:hypothetical protein
MVTKTKNGTGGKWYAYDVAKKSKCLIKGPKAKQLKNGIWAVTGKSALSGNTVFAMVGKEKPKL